MRKGLASGTVLAAMLAGAMPAWAGQSAAPRPGSAVPIPARPMPIPVPMAARPERPSRMPMPAWSKLPVATRIGRASIPLRKLVVPQDLLKQPVIQDSAVSADGATFSVTLRNAGSELAPASYLRVAIWSNLPEEDGGAYLDMKTGQLVIWSSDHTFTSAFDAGQKIPKLAAGETYKATFSLGALAPFINCGAVADSGKCAKNASSKGLVLTMQQSYDVYDGPNIPMPGGVH